MVAHLVRLKLALLRNIFRRSRAQAIGAIVGVLYFGGLVLLLAVAVGALRGSLELALTVIPLGGAVAVVLWSLVPLLAFGSDPTLDPGRFATFAIPYRQLAVGLVLAGLVSLPAIATSVLAAATVVAWSHSVAATLVALLAAAVGVLTCVTTSRWLSAAATSAMVSRRGRDVAAVVGLVVVVTLGPAVSLLGSLGERSMDTLSSVARAVGWTPLGWVWAAPGDVASGHPATGLGRLALGVGVLAAVGTAWARALRKQVENPRLVARSQAVSAADDLGAFRRVPDGATGAVAARLLTYWRRDPRYQASLVLTPVLPLALLVPQHVAGAPWTALLMAPLAAFLLGFSEHNSVSYDSTAFWLHVAAGVPGRADRLGRLVPTALLSVVLVPAYAVLGTWLAGRPDLLPATVGLSLVLLGSGYGISCLMSVALPYAVPKPGDSPFSSPPGATGATLVSQTIAGMGMALLAAPTLVLALLAWWGSAAAGWGAAAGGALLGAAYLVAGLRAGAALYDRRAPELLATLSRD
ncbi:MAG TPA: hypothetical protein VFJ94_01030 [Intrasporangium sp.]|uniref:hypothetical protein n=1 Tax=Intrasporangium sp. TaxID=1925024 RepID=UPI002D793F3B|nr:hypothetical protein [Intrasporangium sp.]HET7397074.1 hypothetical protein [Intrasporangium sp.]